MDKQPQITLQEAPAPLDVLVLAAGLGTRMRSRTAKVLHKLGGRPLVAHVCRTATALSPTLCNIYVIVGHQAEKVEEAVQAELGEDGARFRSEERRVGKECR